MVTSIDSLMREFERQFDRLTGQLLSSAAATMPMDAIRRPDEILLRFDVPGIEPDSLEVEVDRGVLLVSAKREESYGEGDRVFVQERPTGMFTRQVYLPERLDAEGIQAAYDNGVLAVRIPVAETVKPRKVEIAKGDTRSISQ
ncbi:Hsp20/alpha crystallin family protein [Nonomuraea sp. H19]|uniref:Hsp20/alpha crystallin family protein n=1 Tax=Nonomuraea sp. H19 TaxID=3452206 RepID=UPI003F897E24